MPAPQPQELNLPATSGAIVGSGPGEYLGCTVRETSGSAAATVVIYDNASAASGTIVDEIRVASGGSQEEQAKRGDGRAVVNGLYASITGAVQGSVFQ